MFCHICKEKLSYYKGKEIIEIRRLPPTLNDTHYFVFRFHVDCFEKIAGKKYTPQTQYAIDYEDIELEGYKRMAKQLAEDIDNEILKKVTEECSE